MPPLSALVMALSGAGLGLAYAAVTVMHRRDVGRARQAIVTAAGARGYLTTDEMQKVLDGLRPLAGSASREALRDLIASRVLRIVVRPVGTAAESRLVYGLAH